MQNNDLGNSKIDNQLAEYRRRQAEKYKQNESEEQDESVLTNRLQEQVSYEKETYNAPMQKLPPAQPAYAIPSEEAELSDYELAKRMQDEEFQANPYDRSEGQGSINQNDNPTNYGDQMDENGIRQADNYRNDRLIPDPMDEQAQEQEFIRQQQLLYSQYQNNENPGNNNFNQNTMENDFSQAGAPLLNRNNVNHIELPLIGRVNREICN